MWLAGEGEGGRRGGEGRAGRRTRESQMCARGAQHPPAAGKGGTAGDTSGDTTPSRRLKTA